MFATIFEKQGKFGIEVGDAKAPMIEWTDLDQLPQDQTVKDYLLSHGLAPNDSWKLRNKVSRVPLVWAVSPTALLGVVAPEVSTGPVEYIE